MGLLVLLWIAMGLFTFIWLLYRDTEDERTPIWLALFVLVYMGVPISLAFGW